MEPSQVVDRLKAALSEIKDKGEGTVSIGALERYLEALRADAGQSIEILKLDTQRSLASLDVQTKHSIEMFKSVIESGREALNALILINGGAVIALLGFMGATISKGLPQSLGASLTWAILYFGFGVLMGALAFGTRYCSQALYSFNKWFPARIFKIFAILFTIAGYSLFGWGIYRAFYSFSDQFF